MESSSPARRLRLVSLGLFLGTLLLFAPVREFAFLSYDDGKYVTDNEVVKQGLTWAGVRWAFLESHFHMWHPLTSLSHMLDVQLFGLNPGPHHLVNVLLHATSVVLLFRLLHRLTGSWGCSLTAALLFGWHPLRVESVAWVAERKDTLSTVFWLLTLHAYVRFVQAPSPRRRWLTIGVFALGILTKPMIVTLPCVLLLLDFWPLRRWQPPGPGVSARESWRQLRPLLREKLPLFLLTLALSVITYRVQAGGEVLTMMQTTTFADRAGNALVSYVRYVAHLFAPVKLAVLYPHPGAWPAGRVVGALLVLAGVSLWGWQQRQRHPYLLMGWCWFLGVLVPASGLVQAGGAAMADRYSYVATLGLVIPLVWGVADAARRLALPPVVLAALAGAVVLGCGGLTGRQLAHWRDTEALFRHTLQVTANNPIAHFVLGHALLEKQRPAEALPHFLAGLAQNPNDPKAHFQTGRAQLQLNDPATALAAFRRALELKPDFHEARFQLALAHVRLEDHAAAEAELRQFLAAEPENARAWNNLGNLRFLAQDPAGARTCYENAARFEPAAVDAHVNLGHLHLQANDPAAALAAFQQALARQPEAAEIWLRVGLAQEAGRQAREAVKSYQQTLQRAPRHPEASLRLAWLLSTHPDKAVRDGAYARRLLEVLGAGLPDPDVRFWETLAAALAEAGQFADAGAAVERARTLARQQNNPAELARLDAQLAGYQRNQPWRQAP